MKGLHRSFRFRLVASYVVASGVGLAAVFLLLDRQLGRAAIEHVDGLLQSEASRLLDLASRRKAQILRADMERVARHHGPERILLRLLDPQGRVVASSDSPAWESVRFPPPPPHSRLSAASHFDTIRADGRSIRSVYAADQSGRSVHLAWMMGDLDRTARTGRRLLAFGLSLSLLVGALVAGLVVSRALRRVGAVREVAADIARGDLSRRVPISRESDEIRDLAESFNHMLDRIDTLLKELRHVTDDIAHELRTPLTRIRGEAERLLSSPSDGASAPESAAIVVEECDRLIHVVNSMLQIARLEAGRGLAAREPVDMGALVHRTREAFETLLEDKGLTMAVDVGPGSLVVPGDRSSIERVLSNLVDNAIRHTPESGRIRLSCREARDAIEVEVEDTGGGIAESDLPRIFDRFYRAGAARDDQGSGLGLCLARAVISAHGGTIDVRSAPGTGSAFTVRLPRQASGATEEAPAPATPPDMPDAPPREPTDRPA